jgi:hypothetical protein
MWCATASKQTLLPHLETPVPLTVCPFGQLRLYNFQNPVLDELIAARPGPIVTSTGVQLGRVILVYSSGV